VKNRLIIAAGCCIALAALAGPIKTWQAGEVITANDINANFQHIHNLMVGGHGARLVNADVNANAGIAHSKLATPVLLPKMAALMANTCNTVGACSMTFSQGFSNVEALSTTGLYRFTFSVTRPNNSYSVFVQPGIAVGAIPVCRLTDAQTAFFEIQCKVSSSATSMSTMTNTAVRTSVAVLDDNP
jgi:hypothetical protein